MIEIIYFCLYIMHCFFWVRVLFAKRVILRFIFCLKTILETIFDWAIIFLKNSLQNSLQMGNKPQNNPENKQSPKQSWQMRSPKVRKRFGKRIIISWLSVCQEKVNFFTVLLFLVFCAEKKGGKPSILTEDKPIH